MSLLVATLTTMLAAPMAPPALHLRLIVLILCVGEDALELGVILFAFGSASLHIGLHLGFLLIGEGGTPVSRAASLRGAAHLRTCEEFSIFFVQSLHLGLLVRTEPQLLSHKAGLRGGIKLSGLSAACYCLLRAGYRHAEQGQHSHHHFLHIHFVLS